MPLLYLATDMTKMYVKDQNGKYKLVERSAAAAQDTGTQKVGQKTLTTTQALTLEELAARIARLERIVIDPRPNRK